jgi:hypothetical protein
MSSQSSLVISWQRIYDSLPVTAARYEVFFAQPNSFLAISSQLFFQLPNPELTSILFLCSQSHTLADWRLETQLTLILIRLRVTLRLTVYRQSVRLGAKPLESHDQRCFQLNNCGYNPYVTSFLRRGWVCRLQLLLVLASEVILGSEFCGTHDHILLSQIRDSPNLEGQTPVFISHRNRVAQLYTQPLGSLSVAYYDSQGHGGTSYNSSAWTPQKTPFPSNSSIVMDVSLHCRYIETVVLL